MILYDNGLYFVLTDNNFSVSERDRRLNIYIATAFAGSLFAEVFLVRFYSRIIAVFMLSIMMVMILYHTA